MTSRDSKEVTAAIAVLEEAGFYVGCLWHIEDVQSKYECEEYEALEILDAAVGGDWTMEQINIQIDDLSREEKYPEL